MDPFSSLPPQPTPSAPAPVPVAPVPAAPLSVAPTHQRGKGILITLIVVSVLLAGALGFGIWAFVNYLDQSRDVDGRVSLAVAAAVKKQADDDAAKFAEQEKLPNRTFSGPEDYGSVSFDYPKTWSVYVAKDTSSGDTYEAYLHPTSVPPVSARERFALRVLIESRDYDRVIESYQSQVSRGNLQTSAVRMNDQTGTRLDGVFANDIRGSAVIFKIRDKTLTLRTDAETFKGDFDALITTLSFRL